MLFVYVCTVLGAWRSSLMTKGFSGKYKFNININKSYYLQRENLGNAASTSTIPQFSTVLEGYTLFITMMYTVIVL